MCTIDIIKASLHWSKQCHQYISVPSRDKFLGTPRIEPGAAGWEASVLPLCYAAPLLLFFTWSFCSFQTSCWRPWRRGSSPTTWCCTISKPTDSTKFGKISWRSSNRIELQVKKLSRSLSLKIGTQRYKIVYLRSQNVPIKLVLPHAAQLGIKFLGKTVLLHLLEGPF